jgi:hypothetical protein
VNKRHLITLTAAAVLVAVSCAAAGAAQATTNVRIDAPAPLFFLSELPLSPMSQHNAVRKAEDYLDISAFSRKGLIDQLEYDDFSTADATFAVDSITVDWNEQAVKKAKDYLDISGFSRGGLIDQLEYDGFTPAQAQFGVAGAGL